MSPMTYVDFMVTVSIIRVSEERWSAEILKIYQDTSAIK